MVQSKAKSVEQYLAELPADRRAAVAAVRDAIRSNLPDGYEEGMQYGMIGYYVPHRLYPAGYHCDPQQPLPFASLAAQKHHVSVYMFCIYAVPEYEAAFRAEWAATGKRLDMGKGCVRFKKLEDAALDVIGRAIGRVPVATLISHYAAVLGAGGERRAAARKATAQKPVAGKTAAASTKTARTKTASTKTAGNKTASTKTGSSKTAARGKTALRKPAARKAAAQTKPSQRKPAQRKPAARKPPRQPASRKSAAAKRRPARAAARKPAR